MDEFNEGDRIRVDIPNETDVLKDDADRVTGEEREGAIYRVELENRERADFRWRDLRPPLE